MNPAGLAEVLATFGPAYLANQSLASGVAKVWRGVLIIAQCLSGAKVAACAVLGLPRFPASQQRHLFPHAASAMPND